MDHALLEAPLAQQSSEAIWKVFLRIGLPVALQMLGSVGASLATTIILARYANEDVLAGFALADVFCNSLGRWITYGLAAAYDTLAAQAWGAKEHRKIGADGVRVSLILLMTVCVPLTPIWWWASPILEAFGQKRSVANQASIFARIYLPGFYMQAIACALSKAFLAMGKARPVLVSSVLNDTTTLGLIVLFVVAPLQLELTGAAMARTVGSALSLLVLVMWAACDADCRQCWPGLATLSGEAWRGWRDYFRLGLPACLMLLAEALSWDVVTFLAGLTHTATGGERYEPTAILAAQGVLQSTITMTYCVPQAICRGASTVIGNAVGAGDEKRATHAARFTLIAGVLTTSLLVGGLTLLRERVVDAYGAPADVSEIVSKMLLCVAGFLFADGLQMCLTGIITGAGKQNITGPILVVAYFLIGLPSGAVLAFAWPVRSGHPRSGHTPPMRHV